MINYVRKDIRFKYFVCYPKTGLLMKNDMQNNQGKQ